MATSANIYSSTPSATSWCLNLGPRHGWLFTRWTDRCLVRVKEIGPQIAGAVHGDNMTVMEVVVGGRPDTPDEGLIASP